VLRELIVVIIWILRLLATKPNASSTQPRYINLWPLLSENHDNIGREPQQRCDGRLHLILFPSPTGIITLFDESAYQRKTRFICFWLHASHAPTNLLLHVALSLEQVARSGQELPFRHGPTARKSFTDTTHREQES
jgi:hypothetical protein